MQKTEILIYPDKKLRIKTPLIKAVDENLMEDIKTLSKMLSEGENAAGLAATQLGWNYRLFGVKVNPEKGVKIFINPEITATFGEKTFPKIVDKNKNEDDFLEGCLSIPNYWGTVKRYLRIEAKWQEIVNGKLVNKQEVLDGFEAIVFQHEFDHLNGILFIDHVKEDRGKFFKYVNKKMVKWDTSKITF